MIFTRCRDQVAMMRPRTMVRQWNHSGAGSTGTETFWLNKYNIGEEIRPRDNTRKMMMTTKYMMPRGYIRNRHSMDEYKRGFFRFIFSFCHQVPVARYFRLFRGMRIPSNDSVNRPWNQAIPLMLIRKRINRGMPIMVMISPRLRAIPVIKYTK